MSPKSAIDVFNSGSADRKSGGEWIFYPERLVGGD